jgi:uncharacterized membrane protein YgcG
MATFYTQQYKNITKSCLFSIKIFAIFAVTLSLFFGAGAAYAQQKTYSYDFIDVTLNVNKDTTVDVVERQRFNFNGEFHKGWRSIPLRKIDAIADIEVIDARTNTPLKYISRRLNKTDAASWGRYTYRKENGSMNIEWYYDAKNTQREWIIKYKVLGSIAFYDDFDELYWNLLTDYNVPISKVTATVMLPQPVSSSDEIRSTFYSSVTDDMSQNIISYRLGSNSFYYSAENIRPKQKLTIATGWPKGVVEQGAYWSGLISIYWGYIAGFFIVIFSVIAGFLFWYFTERRNTGKGTIIPHYAPPEDLRPAMAEVLVNEGISNKTWPATLIDLAVRGYVTIKEGKPSWTNYIITTVMFIPIILIFLFSFVGSFSEHSMFILTFFIGAIIYFRVFKGGGVKSFFIPKEYIIEKTKEYKERNKKLEKLEDYEKKFLAILFNGKDTFSTKDMKSPGSTRIQEFSRAIKKLKDELYKEFEQDEGVYKQKLSREKTWRTITMIIIFITIFLLAYVPVVFTVIINNQMYFAITVFVVSIISLTIFILSEARLNKRGQILREDWLGFKMYLETAEKYRMQRLTTEVFEKYLPYAMIFGIEKKWAKSFDALNMQSPSWYYGATGSSGISGSGSASFAPGAFATSLGASFASSMSSAGGGASGGGGGAGGGGGGGGGGAS